MTRPVIPALLGGRAAGAALRRAVGRAQAKVVLCRSPAKFERALLEDLADAVVVDARLPQALGVLLRCRERWPRVPRFAYAAFRPDDGHLLLACVRDAAAMPIVEGVEDAVLADLVLPRTASAARNGALEQAPSVLRLEDELQRRAWMEVLRSVGGRMRVADIAAALRVSREHLSRQFGAGGAPNIKRVVDLARTATAAQLLANPGYSVRTVARILRFSSASHLSGAARRVAGVSAAELARIGPRGVLIAFARGRTRSRG